MSNSSSLDSRLERLLDAARWLRLAGDLDGSIRLLEKASALAPSDARVVSMLGYWKVPAKGAVAPSAPVLTPKPKPATARAARPVPELLRKVSGIEVGQRLAAAARALVQSALPKPNYGGDWTWAEDLDWEPEAPTGGENAGPTSIGPPEWAEPVPADLRRDLGSKGEPVEALELYWEDRQPQPQPAAGVARVVGSAASSAPVPAPVPAPRAVPSSVDGNAVAPSVRPPAPVPEVTVLLVSEGVPLAQPIPLHFHEGPLAGQRLQMTHETLHLGEPGQSPTLELREGALRVRAHSVGDDAAVYVALRGETRIGSPTVFRAGTTRFLYERRRDEVGGGELYFLHILGKRRQISQTHLIREAVLTVGRTGCELGVSGDPALEPVHFELTPGPWVTFLEDRSKQAGTFLEQAGGITAPLAAGDRVYTGGHTFTVEAPAGATVASPPPGTGPRA